MTPAHLVPLPATTAYLAPSAGPALRRGSGRGAFACGFRAAPTVRLAVLTGPARLRD